MHKALVAYFSASGRTEKIAELLAKAIKAESYEIEPKVKYTSTDLNWRNPHSRSSIEMGDKSIRPILSQKELDVSEYDIIFIGFPIWWYVAPTIINSFLESLKNPDGKHKKAVLFATSGGSGFGKTLEELACSTPEFITLVEGDILNDITDKSLLRYWANKFLG